MVSTVLMPLLVIWCLLVGDDSIFPVEIIGTQTVEAIKAKMQSLALFDAHTLSLFLLNVTGSDERACIEEANRRALDLSMLRKFNPFAPLIDFLMPQVPGPLIHILVQPPNVVSSIYMNVSLACMRVLNLLLG